LSGANTQGRGGALQIGNVSKQFRGQAKDVVPTLQDVSIEVPPGEFVVLVGPSGCGKSTLLNLIAGFDAPTTGEIHLDGAKVRKPDRDRLMMFQEHALFPWLNVIENVIYGLRWKYRFPGKKRREIARDLLKMVHLSEFEKASIHQLSGGMKQRVALARALAPDPKLLLIDEPFPALDALTRQKLYGDLQQIFVQTRKTIISVTHDTREAACLGDRVIIFSARPARIINTIKIDLPRPRDVNDPAVAAYAQQITAQLEEHGNA
jgi:NitT/TauT family transport system ATP-binding protein